MKNFISCAVTWGCERVKLTKSDPDEWNEMKMSFLNGRMTNLLFYCHIFIY